MNYLAHFLLSHENEQAIAGSILGDFIKGKIDNHGYCNTTSAAIALHREIDSYTDQHEIFIANKRLLAQPYRRYGGIILDIFYDHFLACHWEEYCDQPLEKFSEQIYAALHARQHTFPDRLARMTPYMISENWLCSYRQRTRIARSLKGVGHRLKRENPLSHAVEELDRLGPELEASFLEFFPQLKRHTETHKLKFMQT